MTGPLRLTDHPLQRAGARAVAAMAGRADPSDVTDDDLDRALDEAVEAALMGAAAAKGGPGYGWQKVQLGHFPNAKTTHNTAARRDRADLDAAIRGVLAPTAAERDGTACTPCWYCAAPSDRVLGKSYLPLADRDGIRNTCPPGMDGWPVCPGCRAALFCLPYGALVSASSSVVLTGPDDVEIRYVRANVRTARQLVAGRAADLPGSPRDFEQHVVELLAATGSPAAQAVTVWRYRNDNKAPTLHVASTRAGAGRFLRRVRADPSLRAAWQAARRRSTRRNAAGAVTFPGAQALARSLFTAPEELAVGRWGTSDRFLGLLTGVARAAALADDLATAAALAPLHDAYLQEHLMVPDSSGAVDAAADLLVAWIGDGSGSRGLFQEFVRAHAKAPALGALLVRVQARLMLRGEGPVLTPDDADALVAATPGGAASRRRLFFAVAVRLRTAGVGLGGAAEADEPDFDDATLTDVDLEEVEG